MHQHRIKVAVGQPACAVIVVLLVGPRVNQNVAQAAGHQRTAGLGTRGANHRQDFCGELLAAEGKQFDQQHVGPARNHRRIDQAPALGPRSGDVKHGITTHDSVAVVHAQRREVDALYFRRHQHAWR